MDLASGEAPFITNITMSRMSYTIGAAMQPWDEHMWSRAVHPVLWVDPIAK